MIHHSPSTFSKRDSHGSGVLRGKPEEEEEEEKEKAKAEQLIRDSTFRSWADSPGLSSRQLAADLKKKKKKKKAGLVSET
jgi:hypothetical protein